MLGHSNKLLNEVCDTVSHLTVRHMQGLDAAKVLNAKLHQQSLCNIGYNVSAGPTMIASCSKQVQHRIQGQC